MISYLEFEVIDDVAICRLVGEFIISANPKSARLYDFEEKINEYIATQQKNKKPIKIIVDMEKCQKIISTGLGALIGVQLKIGRVGGEMEVINLQGEPLRYFKLAKMNFLFKNLAL